MKIKNIFAITIGVFAIVGSFATAFAEKPESLDRNKITDDYKWDFSSIYSSWEEWEQAIVEFEKLSDQFAAMKGSLKQGVKTILDAYRLQDEMGKLSYLIYRFPQLQRDVDLRNQNISGYFQRVQAVFAKSNTSSSWFTPELLEIPEKKMRKWLSKSKELQAYSFPILETYRQKEHVLDDSGEKLLSFAEQFLDTPKSIYQELSTSDVVFPEVTLSDHSVVKMSSSGYGKTLRTSTVQDDRKKAFEAHYGTYAANKNTYAAIYNGILQRDWFTAQARNYKTTLGAALDSDNVPMDVYRTLVETVRAGTEPLKRYQNIRKKVLGLDDYHSYDGAIPLVDTAKEYDYSVARDMVVDSVAPLGEQYQNDLRKFLHSRFVDVYENDGKRSGAYAAGVYGVGPYMLMNYNDTLDSVFTLAHESGHAMHTKLSYANQPFSTASYTIFVAEVASTTNERFLLEKMLTETDDAKQRFLLLQKAIEKIAGTFYAQVSFADYEWQAHQRVEQGLPITAEVLSTIYRDISNQYQSDEVANDELYDYLWARIPHFYNSPYYVYKYATCFASSAALFKGMTTGTEEERATATAKYLTLLKSGGNDQPMEQLRKAGVDLSKQETIQAVIDQMNDLVNRLEVEAGKLHNGKM